MFLYGKPLAQKIISELKTRKCPAGALAVVQVADNPVSDLYISKKEAVAKQLGVKFQVVKIEKTVNLSKLEDEIEKLNKDSGVHGIVLQLPLPKQIDRINAAAKIAPEKDIDGFHCILGSRKKCVPPTVLAICGLLDFYKIGIKSKKIVIVGSGFLVGKPLQSSWKEAGHDVVVLTEKDANYAEVLKSGEIVVVATGGGRGFEAEDFSPQAVVIDASTVADEGRMRGDVKVESWSGNRSLSPVPGGVGPVTVAMLFKNFYDIAP
jgi:methylenetetrahydrofolate dehydrogenase (NADP+)/methenyltetrahydrofolate cyclohydrolase